MAEEIITPDPVAGGDPQGDPQAAATQGQSNPTPPAQIDGSGNGAGQPSTTTPAPQGVGQLDDDKVQAALREYGKLSKYQELYEPYGGIEKAVEDLQRLKTIEDRSLASPDTYRTALRNYTDMSEVEIDQTIMTLRQQGMWRADNQYLSNSRGTDNNRNRDHRLILMRQQQRSSNLGIYKRSFLMLYQS